MPPGTSREATGVGSRPLGIDGDHPAPTRLLEGLSRVYSAPGKLFQEEGHIAMRLGDGPVRVLGLWWLSHAMRGELKARWASAGSGWFDTSPKVLEFRIV